MQKTVNTKAKASKKSSTMSSDLDVCFPWGHQLFHNNSSKMQTQGFSDKDLPRPKKSKNKNFILAPPCGNIAEPAMKEDMKKSL